MLCALFEWRFSMINSAMRNIAMPRIAKNVGSTPHIMMIQAADWADWNCSSRSVSMVICIKIGIKNALSSANPMFDRPSRVSRRTMSTPDVGSKTGRFVQTLNEPKDTGQRDRWVKWKNPAKVRIEITNVTPANRRNRNGHCHRNCTKYRPYDQKIMLTTLVDRAVRIFCPCLSLSSALFLPH